MLRLRAKEMALLALLSAILLIGQIALGFLPNIEVVTLLLMVYTIVFRKKVFFIIYIFVLAEGLVYGFGIWWINYLYVWSIQAAVNLLFRKQKSVVFWSILAGFYGITFGALCSLPYFAIGGPSAAFPGWPMTFLIVSEMWFCAWFCSGLWSIFCGNAAGKSMSVWNDFPAAFVLRFLAER